MDRIEPHAEEGAKEAKRALSILRVARKALETASSWSRAHGSRSGTPQPRSARDGLQRAAGDHFNPHAEKGTKEELPAAKGELMKQGTMLEEITKAQEQPVAKVELMKQGPRDEGDQLPGASRSRSCQKQGLPGAGTSRQGRPATRSFQEQERPGAGSSGSRDLDTRAASYQELPGAGAARFRIFLEQGPQDQGGQLP